MYAITKNLNGYELKVTADGNDVFTSCVDRVDTIAEITDVIVSREGTSLTERLTVKADSAKPAVGPFEIKAVQSNRAKNVFTVAWKDGTVTSVHCQPGDDWDDEKALAMCFTKKALGNKGNFNDKFNDALAHMKTIPAPEEKTIPAIPVADKPDITIDGKWRIVDRHVEVGDYICLKTDGSFTFSQPGDILLVSKVTKDLAKVKAKDHPRDAGDDPEYLWSYMPCEYDVVEPISVASDTAPIDEWRVVDRPAKVGDHVRLVTTCFTFNTIGDILPVDVKEYGIIGVKAKSHPYDTEVEKDYIWWYADGMYEVVEPTNGAADATDAMADALARLTESAHETGRNIGEALAKKLEKSGLTEKINELCGSAPSSKTEANPWPKKSEITQCKKDLGHRYNVYLYGIFTESNKFLFRAKTIEEVRKFIADDGKARGHGFYSRLWNGKENDLYIDYGSHTHYYHITGTNIEEYAYN